MSMEFDDARKEACKASFESKAVDGKASPRVVWELLFNAEEKGEYGFSSFEEDLFATIPECKDTEMMTWENVLTFLDENL